MDRYDLSDSRKKLVQINTVCNNSTGHIMHDIQRKAHEEGYDTISFVGRRKVYSDLPCEKFGNSISFWIHVIINTLFDRQGHGSLFQTKRLIARLREEKPDIIHLHNLHGYYLHIPTLFAYLQDEYKGKLFWTFHDLWPITGHCAHYVMAGCNKWKTECNKCPNKKVYPISWGLDCSRINYKEKKSLFTNMNHLEIIAPSNWVAEQVKESFLQDVPVHVVSNGIDLEAFQYVYEDETYRKYGISTDKKVILGVASVWEKRKGLNVFLELANLLEEEYVIVLVGLTESQKKKLSKRRNIVGIQRTEKKDELVALYSRADVLLNPSQEETFSLVTVESMACGTPVVGVNTSAVGELINDNNGVLLHKNGLRHYVDAIELLQEKNIERECVRRTVMQYSVENMVNNVVQLY